MILFHLVDREILLSSQVTNSYSYSDLLEILEQELRLLLTFAPVEEFVILSPSFVCESRVAQDLVKRCLPLVDAQLIRLYMREDNIFDLRIKKIDQNSYGRVFAYSPEIEDAYRITNIQKISDMHIPIERKLIHVGRSSFDQFVPHLLQNAKREKWNAKELLKRLKDSERQSFLWPSVLAQLDKLAVPNRTIIGLGIRPLMNASYLNTFRAEKIKIPINSRVITNPMFGIHDNVRETIDLNKLKQLARMLGIYNRIMSMSCNLFAELKVGNPDFEMTRAKIMEILRTASSFSEALQKIKEGDLDNQIRKIVDGNYIILKEYPKMKKKKVFIVHGHDDAAKETTARFLEKAGVEPIILHEQANGGRTIIEKIEDYSDVAYAVVLYTECDVGRDRKADSKELKFRARQNVVFEHGYLMGKLGRNRVFALVKGDVEKPGDISGVVYTTMDDKGGWKIELLKDMKQAGVDTDVACLF